MDNEKKLEIVWQLSSSTKKSLGMKHLKWLFKQSDPIQVCQRKLAHAGITTCPQAYEELLAVLVRRLP